MSISFVKWAEAMAFAANKHVEQRDDGGNPYFVSHLMQVLKIMMDITEDEDVLAAAILHDTLEDTDTTYEELEEKFGKRVADLVNAVTHEGKKDNHGYYFPRLQPTLENRDAILIKFADRLSNLSRMEPWDAKRRSQYLKKSCFWRTDGPDSTSDDVRGNNGQHTKQNGREESKQQD